MQTLPRDIQLGMKVFDNSHKEIGRIDDLRFSENTDDPMIEPADIDGTDRKNQRETILGAIAEAFGERDIPEALRDRLLREGYIRLDTKGLLAHERYILPSQIASTGSDGVLNVGK